MENKVLRTFTLTETHIELISKFHIQEGYAEACPPEVNQKRPWGNSDHLYDMAEIMKLPIDEDESIYDQEELCEKLEVIYKELVDALQIVLATKSFKPGLYEFWGKYEWHASGPAGWKYAEEQPSV